MTDAAEFLSKDNLFAVVGVSHDTGKYGNRVYRDLLGAGYDVCPIHPDGGEIDGRTRYADLAALPRRPDVVVCVVLPKATEKVVAQCAALGIGKVWMQPGAESAEAIALCEQSGIDCVHDQCVMILRPER